MCRGTRTGSCGARSSSAEIVPPRTSSKPASEVNDKDIAAIGILVTDLGVNGCVILQRVCSRDE